MLGIWVFIYLFINPLAGNTMLGFNTLIEYSGATFLIDNGALKRSVSYLPILSTVTQCHTPPPTSSYTRRSSFFSDGGAQRNEPHGCRRHQRSDMPTAIPSGTRPSTALLRSASLD